MKEVALQRSILERVHETGGYGWKLSNQFVSGVPDLLLFLPGFAPVVAEVKDLGEMNHQFDVKIAVTPLQRERLMRIAVYGNFSILLVTVKHKGTDYVIGYNSYVTRATADSFRGERSTIRRKGHFRLDRVFDALGVPRIECPVGNAQGSNE